MAWTGDMVKEFLNKLNITETKLAEELGVTFSTVSRWRNGHVNPSKLANKVLDAYAKEWGIDPASLTATAQQKLALRER